MEVTEQALFEEKKKAAVAALRELSKALLTGENGLFTKTANTVAPLREEADRLNAEARTLTEKAESLRPMAEARQRVILRQTDDLLAAGDEEQARALRAEAEELETNLQNTLDRAQSCRTRAAELQREIKRVGERIYGEVYPELRTSSVEVCQEIVHFFDAIRDGIQRHAFTHNYRLKPDDLGSLTGRELSSEERPIVFDLMRLFGGRG